MLTGITVLSVMAAIWCLLGLVLTQAPLVWFAAPLLVSSAFILVARGRLRSAPPRSVAEEQRVGKIMGRCIAFEGVGITLTATVLANTGLAAFIPADIAVFVGLHLLPMARGLPVRLYYATAGLMIAAGVSNVLEPSQFGIRPLSLTCGVVLWLTTAIRIAGRM